MSTLNSESPILVTGGAGFIGANFVVDWLASTSAPVINLDKLTYAGNLENLASLKDDPRHIFVRGDIGDAALIEKLLKQYQPRAIVNFAAESHVDRSIHGPEDFVQTNVVGTFHLLETPRVDLQAVRSNAHAPLRVNEKCRTHSFVQNLPARESNDPHGSPQRN